VTHALLLSATQCHGPFAHLQHIQTHRGMSSKRHEHKASMPCIAVHLYTLHSYRRRGPLSEALSERIKEKGWVIVPWCCTARAGS
jgi:hypothetical protein